MLESTQTEVPLQPRLRRLEGLNHSCGHCLGRYRYVLRGSYGGLRVKPRKPRAAVVVGVEEIYVAKPGEYGRRIRKYV